MAELGSPQQSHGLGFSPCSALPGENPRKVLGCGGHTGPALWPGDLSWGPTLIANFSHTLGETGLLRERSEASSTWCRKEGRPRFSFRSSFLPTGNAWYLLRKNSMERKQKVCLNLSSATKELGDSGSLLCFLELGFPWL